MRELFERIDAYQTELVSQLCDLVSIPALSPLYGGCGEGHKADYIIEKLKTLEPQQIEVYNANDQQIPGCIHPNIVARFPGDSKKRIWLVAHMDVVPAGDEILWKSAPFRGSVRNGHIFGRGCNDNGEAIAASLAAIKAFADLKKSPANEVCLCFVSDEETGSAYGLQHLLSHEELFSADDLIVVPDNGSLDGGFIEIAEKSILWVQFEVRGKSVHASVPDRGINACRAANELSFLLDEKLHGSFAEKDHLFMPPFSTFEPTKRQSAVNNINTVPGLDCCAFDCRLLPGISLERVKRIIQEIVSQICGKYNVEIDVSYPQDNEASLPTNEDAQIVVALKKAISSVLPVKAHTGGIGGGTCASFFRKCGLPVAVWGQCNDSAHQPNESIAIEHALNEAKVFAALFAGV